MLSDIDYGYPIFCHHWGVNNHDQLTYEEIRKMFELKENRLLKSKSKALKELTRN